MIRRPADHHPEREVAAYVSGEMSPKDLRRFEAHLLECELCWQEVQLNREGRRLAESSREPAPASLREDVRAAVALSVGRRRHRRPMFIALVAASAVTATAVGLVWLGPHSDQPPEIAAALASYRSQAMPAEPPERGAPDLSAAGLQLAESGATRLGSMPADVYLYLESSGTRVLVFMSSRTFPEATGATQRGSMSSGWTARVEGLSLVCGSRPVSFLLVGVDPTLLQRVERTLAAQLR